MKVFQIVRLVAVSLCLTTSWPTSASAQMVEQLNEVVGKILDHEAVRDKKSVCIGEFVNRPTQDLHAGSAIKQQIIECLKQRNVNVVKRDQPSISGRYYYATKDGATIDIELNLDGPGGEELQMYPVRVAFKDDNHEVLNIAAPSSVKLPTTASGHDRGQEVVSALNKPQVQVKQAMVAAPAGQYAVTITADNRGDFKPADVHNESGFAYVQLKMGQTYRILVKNNSPHEAVASVTVDGLDTFVFADEKSPGYLIPANGGEQEIKGWFVNNKRADSFVVGKFSKTPAAELLGDAADAGVICVQFKAAWTGGNKPPDEGGTLGTKVGTERGPSVTQNAERVPREIGKIREAVSIRYGVDPPN